MSLQSPLGRVLGLGSAKDGVSHWWNQRISAVALVLLGLWFVISLLALSDLAYASITGWIREPLNSVLLLLLLITMAFHSSLGIQVVVEDYVHEGWLKIGTLVLAKFAHILFAVVGAFAILRISFGA